MINAISPIRYISFMQTMQNTALPPILPDSVNIENPNVNKKPLIERKIIGDNVDINEFFDTIASQVFQNSTSSSIFADLLKRGYVSLSSSCYRDLKVPQSAIGIKLDSTKMPFQNCAYLEEYVQAGIGVGINFNDFKNPIDQIKRINGYFKFREQNTNRPPAGIALLSLNHPAIMKFISLKDAENAEEWCFDLSVIMDDKFLYLVDTNQSLEMQDGTKMPAKQIYDALIASMLKTGEPGVVFSIHPDHICDCCNATQLQPGEGMTIAHINLAKFYNPKAKNFCDCNYLKYVANILKDAIENIDPNGFIGILGYQELINQMGYQYGSKDANQVLEDCLTIIKSSGCKMALPPTSTVSKVLKTTPSIEPSDNTNLTYQQEIDVMSHAQKYLEGGISKTIHLKKDATLKDVDEIVRYAAMKKIKGITVYPS